MKRTLSNRRSSTVVDHRSAKRQKTYSTRDITWEEQRTLGADFAKVGEGSWPVLTIIAEKGKKKHLIEYLIEWKPHPETGEEFEPQWLSHLNVADDLIRDWKRQKSILEQEVPRQVDTTVTARRRRNRRIITDSSGDATQDIQDQSDVSLTPPSLESRGSSVSAVEISETQDPAIAEPITVKLPPLPNDKADYETLRTSQLSPSTVNFDLTSPPSRIPITSSQSNPTADNVNSSSTRPSRAANSQYTSKTLNSEAISPQSHFTDSSPSTSLTNPRPRSKLGKFIHSAQGGVDQLESPSQQSLHLITQLPLTDDTSAIGIGQTPLSSSKSRKRSVRLSSPFEPARSPLVPNSDSLVSLANGSLGFIEPTNHQSLKHLPSASSGSADRRSPRNPSRLVELNTESLTLQSSGPLATMATPSLEAVLNETVTNQMTLPLPNHVQQADDVSTGGSLFETANDIPLITSGQLDPGSMVIHESIEEEPLSSADTSQLSDSKANSSQESLNNERQVETVDGIMIPTLPILGPNEYALPLPAEGKVKSAYDEIIKLKKKSILKFIQRKGSPGTSEISSKKTTERNEMQEMLRRLNDTVTHFDLGLGMQTQYSVNSQENAAYADYAGSKFVMLGYLIDQFKDKDCSMAIFSQQGELQDLLSSYLRMKHITVHRPDRSAENGASRTSSNFTVELFSSYSGESHSLQRKPALIMAFDVSFSAADPQVKALQQQFGNDIPVIHLLVINSSEHVERCVPEALTSNIRLKVVVRTTYLAAPSLGGEITYVPDESDQPADGRPMDMSDLQRAVRKSPERRMALIADILADAALNGDFVEKWDIGGMPELKLAPFETPFRVSRAASRTPQPRTPRALTPLSRAITPMGRKRLLEVEGENGTKRQRLTPMGDGASDIRSQNITSEEFAHARKQISDLTAELAGRKTALAVAEQKQISAELKAVDWEQSLGELQRRYEKHTSETKQLRRENKKLNQTVTAMKERDEKSLNEKIDLRRQITELKSQLSSARDDLKSAGGDIAALEEAREESRNASAKVAAIEKTLNNTKTDLEFTRERYQDASRKAADSATEIKTLESEMDKLKLAANDSKRSLKAMNYQTSLQKAYERAEQFKLEVKNRDAVIKKLQDENAALKTRRGVQTRGSSVQPVSSPGPRSRQASPAPGHLLPHSGSRASALRHER